MADLSRLAFRASAVVSALALTLGFGLYSGDKHNALFKTVSGVGDTVKDLAGMLRWRPVRFLRTAVYRGAGVTVNKVGTDDLVLLSGFLGDDQKAELIQRDGKIIHAWRLRPLELLPSAKQCRNPPLTNWKTAAHNTIIQPDGSIVVSFESCGMVKLDRCGRKLWATRQITHHSPNFLANGGIAIGGGELVKRKMPWPFVSPFWEDTVDKYDANGKLVMRKPATALFLANGWAPQLTASTAFDAKIDGEFHLNEVEELSPALAPKFPMFRAGDLLASFRNLNLLVVTDANFEKIKWSRTGPWIRQHDPDWNANGWITVFDNHPDGTDRGRVNGGSRIVAVNPATNETKTLYGGIKGQNFSSSERGLHQMQPDGSILITEAYYGRAFQVNPSGQVVWEYINRYDANNAAWLHGAEAWPRSYFTVKDWSCKAGGA